eukprot:scaffold1117_cov167-Amphora_coffeaeformis.AAC.13
MRSALYSTAFRASRAVVSRAALASRRVAASPPSMTMVQYQPRAAFSAVTDSLIDILKREYDEEKENETTVMPDELKGLHKQIQERDWKIVEEGAITRLFSTIGAHKVQIFFHCQDTVEEEYEEEGEEDEEEAAPAFRFTVTVTKAGKSMVFICLSRNAECNIESVNLTKTDVAELDNGVPETEYQGPEFLELATELQEEFHNYLSEEIGIDEDMAAFISMYADYKEQSNYVEFLESTRGLLS